MFKKTIFFTAIPAGIYEPPYYYNIKKIFCQVPLAGVTQLTTIRQKLLHIYPLGQIFIPLIFIKKIVIILLGGDFLSIAHLIFVKKYCIILLTNKKGRKNI